MDFLGTPPATEPTKDYYESSHRRFTGIAERGFETQPLGWTVIVDNARVSFSSCST